MRLLLQTKRRLRTEGKIGGGSAILQRVAGKVAPGHVEAAAAWRSAGVRSISFSPSLSLFAGLQRCRWKKVAVHGQPDVLCSLTVPQCVSLSFPTVGRGARLSEVGNWLIWECFDWRCRGRRRRSLGVMENYVPGQFSGLHWIHSQKQANNNWRFDSQITKMFPKRAAAKVSMSPQRSHAENSPTFNITASQVLQKDRSTSNSRPVWVWLYDWS